jgi:hypothetical protein
MDKQNASVGIFNTHTEAEEKWPQKFTQAFRWKLC